LQVVFLIESLQNKAKMDVQAIDDFKAL